MVLKRKFSLNAERIQQEEESENLSISLKLTPTETKHFRRQLSEQNF
ncbi:unnamed protein product, partial [Rotaria sp. Silwood2]